MNKKGLSRRDFLALSAGTAAGTLLAACQPQVIEKTVEVEVEKVVTPTPVPIEMVEIDFWWGWGGDLIIGALEAACRRFEELNPGIKVRTAQHEWGEKMYTALAAGEPPDIFQWGNAVEMAAREAVIPMDALVDTSESLSWDSFYDVCWDLSRWQGQLFGVPGLEQFAVVGQIASVEVYESKGLKVPDDLPVTFSDVKEQILGYSEYDSAGNLTLLWGEISQWNWYWWEVVLGIHAYEKDTGTYDFSDPLWVDAYEWTGDLYRTLGPGKYEAFRESHVSWRDVEGNSFASGTQAWESQAGYWEPGQMANSAPDKEFVWYWNPVWDHRAGVKAQEIGGHALCIPNDSKHPDEAWKLIEFLVSKEALKIIYDGCGFLTATREFLDDPGSVVDFFKYPGLKFFVDSIKEADELWAEPRGPVDGFIFDQFTELTNAVIYGDTSAEESVGLLQTLVDEEVARVKRE